MCCKNSQWWFLIFLNQFFKSLLPILMFFFPNHLSRKFFEIDNPKNIIIQFDETSQMIIFKYLIHILLFNKNLSIKKSTSINSNWRESLR